MEIMRTEHLKLIRAQAIDMSGVSYTTGSALGSLQIRSKQRS
jgi:hypothetical protein